jgi:hypothetical protein
MTGKQLKDWCMEMGGERGCSECPAKKVCAKWKEDLKKLSEMEPWQLDEMKKIMGHLFDGYDYKHGREL